MKKALASVAFATLIAGLSCVGTTPARAEVEYPWCAIYLDSWGTSENCGFYNYQQCRASVSGVGGYCRENLRIGNYVETAPVVKRKRRHRNY